MSPRKINSRCWWGEQAMCLLRAIFEHGVVALWETICIKQSIFDQKNKLQFWCFQVHMDHLAFRKRHLPRVHGDAHEPRQTKKTHQNFIQSVICGKFSVCIMHLYLQKSEKCDGCIDMLQSSAFWFLVGSSPSSHWPSAFWKWCGGAADKTIWFIYARQCVSRLKCCSFDSKM